MSNFILVHGAWHGAWCWYKVVAELERQGHTVAAIDLPAMGVDKLATQEVTLESWNDALVSCIEAQYAATGEPPVVVGHSRGGINISVAAESVPDKIKKVVYLCAFVAVDGESAMEGSARDPDSGVPAALQPSADGTYLTVDDSVLEEVFYADCSAEDVALARLCLVPEPTASLSTPVSLSESRFGQVPKAYILCRDDRALTLPFQQSMAQRCDESITMNTSHSPFFSAPADLAAHLNNLAN